MFPCLTSAPWIRSNKAASPSTGILTVSPRTVSSSRIAHRSPLTPWSWPPDTEPPSETSSSAGKPYVTVRGRRRYPVRPQHSGASISAGGTFRPQGCFVRSASRQHELRRTSAGNPSLAARTWDRRHPSAATDSHASSHGLPGGVILHRHPLDPEVAQHFATPCLVCGT